MQYQSLRLKLDTLIMYNYILMIWCFLNLSSLFISSCINSNRRTFSVSLQFISTLSVQHFFFFILFSVYNSSATEPLLVESICNCAPILLANLTLISSIIESLSTSGTFCTRQDSGSGLGRKSMIYYTKHNI